MDNWDKLLEKYFEGQTNLKEEERLKVYINGPQVSENHKPYRMLFGDHDWNSLPKMDADPFSKIDFNSGVKRFKIRQWTAIAATALLLLFAAVFTTQQDHSAQEFDMAVYEPQSEEEAYEQTLMALEMLSKKLNNSTSSLEKGIHGLKQASEIINQNN